MSDIVERLRTAANNNRIQAERGTTTTGEILTALGCQTKEAVASMHDDAADEIERLRTTLQQALVIIAEFGNLNGFRNMSNAELGKAVIGMAERIVAVLPPPPEKENT